MSNLYLDDVLRTWGKKLYGIYSPARSNPTQSTFSKADIVRHTIKSTVRRTPEVMLKITGGSKNVKQFHSHVRYISRDGQVEIEDERGYCYKGDEVNQIARDWRDSGYRLPQHSNQRKEVYQMVFSMPPGTNGEAVRSAVRTLAQEQFKDHQYVMAFHQDEAHPHVHLAVKATDLDGRRLYPRKKDIQQWRQSFAEQLRERGISANATCRAARGVIQKPNKQSILQLVKRGQISTVQVSQKKAILDNLQGITDYRNPAKENILLARRQVIDAYGHMAKALARSSSSEDQQLAKEIVGFVKTLPKVMTHHEKVVEKIKSLPLEKDIERS